MLLTGQCPCYLLFHRPTKIIISPTSKKRTLRAPPNPAYYKIDLMTLVITPQNYQSTVLSSHDTPTCTNRFFFLHFLIIRFDPETSLPPAHQDMKLIKASSSSVKSCHRLGDAALLLDLKHLQVGIQGNPTGKDVFLNLPDSWERSHITKKTPQKRHF